MTVSAWDGTRPLFMLTRFAAYRVARPEPRFGKMPTYIVTFDGLHRYLADGPLPPSPSGMDDEPPQAARPGGRGL